MGVLLLVRDLLRLTLDLDEDELEDELLRLLGLCLLPGMLPQVHSKTNLRFVLQINRL